MRILLLTHYSTLKFGSNLSLCNLIEGAAGTQITYHVIAPREGELLTRLGEQNISTSVLRFPWWMNERASLPGRIKRSVQSAIAAHKIARYAQANSIDIIHSNTSVIHAGILAARFARLPHIWHLREFGYIDHGVKPDLGWRFHRSLVRKSTATVSVSRAVQNHHLGTWRNRFSQVIFNGVLPGQRFSELASQHRPRAESPDRLFTFIIVGRIAPKKGQLTALQALRSLMLAGQPARLRIVGEGDSVYTQTCQRFVVENGMQDFVSFEGYQADPFPFYRSADASLVCSVNEAMGRVTAEAMAASLPVIGVGSGGTRELIQNHVTGMLVANSSTAFAEAMAQLVTDRQKARELGRQAFAWSRANCTSEQYASSLRSLYQSLAFQRGRARFNRGERGGCNVRPEETESKELESRITTSGH